MANGLRTPISDGQRQALEELAVLAIHKAIKTISLDKLRAQACLANGGDIQQDIIAAISKRVFSGKFTLLGGFKIKVPDTYDHQSQLGAFRDSRFVDSSRRYGCQYQQGKMTDDAFNWTKDALRPSRLYYVSFVEYVGASLDDCLDFLSGQEALFVGPQGLSLILQLKHQDLPAGKRILSFGKPRNELYDQVGGRRVPYASVHWVDHNLWSFGVADLQTEFSGNREWPGGYCLLCVKEAE